MPRASALRALLIACAFCLAGCSTSSTSPTFGTISAASLSGVWKLQVLKQSGQPAIAAPAEASYSMTIEGDAVSFRADCNVCNGRFTLVGDSITISSSLACTRAACPTQSFEVIYTALVAGESRVDVSGTTLMLNSSRGMLQFTR
jgi:heat shock protein HslJ